jgi:hypothetical protein
MRVATFIFALMLVMGVSFGGASLINTQSAFAGSEEAAPEGEMPGGEMEDAAEGDTDGSGSDVESTEGELPGGEMEDDAAK